jgi:hypothetical protein
MRSRSVRRGAEFAQDGVGVLRRPSNTEVRPALVLRNRARSYPVEAAFRRVVSTTAQCRRGSSLRPAEIG